MADGTVKREETSEVRRGGHMPADLISVRSVVRVHPGPRRKDQLLYGLRPLGEFSLILRNRFTVGSAIAVPVLT